MKARRKDSGMKGDISVDGEDSQVYKAWLFLVSTAEVQCSTPLPSLANSYTCANETR